jgi:hypothetical protein
VPEINNDGSVTITPFRPPWLTFADQNEMEAIIPKKKTQQIVKRYEPLKIERVKMSRDGNLEIIFNQNIVIPGFFNSSRNLNEIEEFDI